MSDSAAVDRWHMGRFVSQLPTSIIWSRALSAILCQSSTRWGSSTSLQPSGSAVDTSAVDTAWQTGAVYTYSPQHGDCYRTMCIVYDHDERAYILCNTQIESSVLGCVTWLSVTPRPGLARTKRLSAGTRYLLATGDTNIVMCRDAQTGPSRCMSTLVSTRS